MASFQLRGHFSDRGIDVNPDSQDVADWPKARDFGVHGQFGSQAPFEQTIVLENQDLEVRTARRAPRIARRGARIESTDFSGDSETADLVRLARGAE